MILKFEQYNESIKSLLVGPSKEEIWENLGYYQSFETPEEFFLYMIDGMKIKKQTKYPDSIFWEKNGKIIFEQDLKNNDLWVDYNSIWKILEKIFGFDNTEIDVFIEYWVEEYLDWKGLTPNTGYGDAYLYWRWSNL